MEAQVECTRRTETQQAELLACCVPMLLFDYPCFVQRTQRDPVNFHQFESRFGTFIAFYVGMSAIPGGHGFTGLHWSMFHYLIRHLSNPARL